jgi:molybdate transport system ATP-binding protein
VTQSDSSKATALIELSHCSLILDDEPVLDDVSFALRPGERWALVGANGSGKTMLLKLLRGDMWPTPTGRERRTYCLDGTPQREPGGIKERIAYIGPERQDKYVRYDWDLTVEQIVTTGLFDEDIPLTTPTRSQRAKVDRVLRRFQLRGLRTRRMLRLSYGQRRRVLVARAFASDAKVLLLDEVFNGLDRAARRALKLALERPRGGHDWIVTTHRPHELPANITHVAHIEAGRIVSAGPVSQRPLPAAPRKIRKRSASAVPTSARRAGSSARRNAPLLVIKHADVYLDYRKVLSDVSLTLHRGEHWAVMGANGSGKSTLLRLIHGDLHPAFGGTIQRHGVPFGTHIERWKQRVGWVSPELQADHFLAASLEEVVISGRYSSVGLNAPPTAADRRAATRWFRHFDIEALRDRKPRQVSYGQMRIALLARAMINDPQLLLLDEPCTGLDGQMRKQILGMLEDIARNGTQLVMAVHDEHDIVPASARVLRIEKGGRILSQADHRPTGKLATGQKGHRT